MSERFQLRYADGVGLMRCEWCMGVSLSTVQADVVRRNLSTIIATGDPASAVLAREALAQLQQQEPA